jgi:hypothetical protein
VDTLNVSRAADRDRFLTRWAGSSRASTATPSMRAAEAVRRGRRTHRRGQRWEVDVRRRRAARAVPHARRVRHHGARRLDAAGSWRRGGRTYLRWADGRTELVDAPTGWYCRRVRPVRPPRPRRAVVRRPARVVRRVPRRLAPRRAPARPAAGVRRRVPADRGIPRLPRRGRARATATLDLWVLLTYTYPAWARSRTVRRRADGVGQEPRARRAPAARLPPAVVSRT